jgi:hypothetical protein
MVNNLQQDFGIRVNMTVDPYGRGVPKCAPGIHGIYDLQAETPVSTMKKPMIQKRISNAPNSPWRHTQTGMRGHSTVTHGPHSRAFNLGWFEAPLQGYEGKDLYQRSR